MFVKQAKRVLLASSDNNYNVYSTYITKALIVNSLQTITAADEYTRLHNKKTLIRSIKHGILDVDVLYIPKLISTVVFYALALK